MFKRTKVSLKKDHRAASSLRDLSSLTVIYMIIFFSHSFSINIEDCSVHVELDCALET